MAQNDNIQLFEDKRIRTAWDEEKEEWYFSVVDVVAVLTDQPDYQAARNYWKVTKKRLKDEGNETVTACNQLKMTASDGKKRLTDVADTEQLLRIIQSIPSPKAEPFKLWLAQVGRERIEETIDPELTIDRALETYLKKGYSREWINQRLQAIQVRKELTDEWDARGVQKGVEYAILTDEISRAWSGMSTRQYKNLKGLKKENLRDNMTTLELVLNMLAEATTTQFSRDRKPTTFQENLAVAKAGGQVAGRTRKDIESQSDTPVITAKNAAQLNQVVTDLLDTLRANLDHCVGMAANMIGVRKNIIAVAAGPFQFAMIAFNHVVPVLNLSVFNVRRAPAFAFEQSKRATIGGRFIRVDESRDLPLLHVVEDFTQKPVCSFAVTTGGEIKIDSAAPAVDGPVQIRPAAIDLHVGFIHVPRAKIGRVTPVPAQPFFHFRRITLNPAVNRGVIDIHSAFSQHLLQLTVTDAVFAVPAYGPQNDVTLKMPAFEWVHVQLHQQKGMISLSPPTICNSARNPVSILENGSVNMPRRSILSAAERESLLALPDSKDDLIRHYTFNDTDLSIRLRTTR